MSTVIILCPAMPHQSNIDDWIEREVLTQFSWNLQGPKNISGVGRIADIPFVDEAIVYLDTADVRRALLGAAVRGRGEAAFPVAHLRRVAVADDGNVFVASALTPP